MSGVEGSWNLSVVTPMGPQTGTVALTTDGSSLSGSATTMGETVDIYEGSVDGDSMTGTAQAGAFPPAALTGARQ